MRLTPLHIFLPFLPSIVMLSSNNDVAPLQEFNTNPSNEQVCMLGLYAVGAAFLSLACQKEGMSTGTLEPRSGRTVSQDLQHFDSSTSLYEQAFNMDDSCQRLYKNGVRAQSTRQNRQAAGKPSPQSSGNMTRLLRRSVEEHRIRPDPLLAEHSTAIPGKESTKSFDLLSSARPRLSLSSSRPKLSQFPYSKTSVAQAEKDTARVHDYFVQNISNMGISGAQLAFDAPPSPTDPRQMEHTFSPPDDYLRTLGERHKSTGWHTQSPFATFDSSKSPRSGVKATDYSEIDAAYKPSRGTFSRFFSMPRRKSRAASAPFSMAEEQSLDDMARKVDPTCAPCPPTLTSSRFRQRARSMSLDIPKFARNSMSALRSSHATVYKSANTGSDVLCSSPQSAYDAEQELDGASHVPMESNPSSDSSKSPSFTRMDDLPRESQSSDSDYDGVSSAQRSDHTLDSVDTDSSDSDDDEDDIEWETESPSRTSQHYESHLRASQPVYAHQSQNLIETARQRPSFGNVRSGTPRTQPRLQHSRSSPLLDGTRSTSSHDSRSAGHSTSRFGSKTTELAAVYLRNIIPSKLVYSSTASASSPNQIQTSSVSRPSTSMPPLQPTPLAEAKDSSPQSSLKLFSDAASSTSSRTSPEWSTLEELVITETKFLKDVQTLSSVYLDGMRQMELMTSASLDKIRSNLDEVISLSKHLINMILSHIPTFSVSMEDEDLLALSTVLAKELPPRLEVFTRYCLSLAGAQERLAFEIQLRPAVGKYIQVCKSTNPNLQGMDLSQFLVLPMHRVTRYPLLFGNLAKKSARKQSWSNYNTELREEDEEGADQAISEIQRCQERQDSIHRNWTQLCDATSAICKITNLAISYQELPPPKEKRRMSMSPAKTSSAPVAATAAATGSKGPGPFTVSSQPPAPPAFPFSHPGEVTEAKQEASISALASPKPAKKGFGRYMSGMLFQGFRTPNTD